MSQRIAKENIFGPDENGVERLLYATGDPIPEGADAPKDKTGDSARTVAGMPDLTYDGLSEAEVLERLSGLSPEQLAEVREYEQAGKARGSITSYGLTPTEPSSRRRT